LIDFNLVLLSAPHITRIFGLPTES